MVCFEFFCFFKFDKILEGLLKLLIMFISVKDIVKNLMGKNVKCIM